MTERKSREELVALLDAYADHALDEVDRREVHSALQNDQELREEYEEVKLTLELLREIPPPPSPQNMVARVRAQLDADAKQADVEQDKPSEKPLGDDVNLENPQLSLEILQESFANETSANASVIAFRPRRYLEIALALCASAAVVVGLVFAGSSSTNVVSEGGFHAAGVGQEQVAHTTLAVAGLDKAEVVALAKTHALQIVSTSNSEVVLEGKGIDALAFCQKGRSKVALSGKWQGLNPRATGKVRLVLHLK